MATCAKREVSRTPPRGGIGDRGAHDRQAPTLGPRRRRFPHGGEPQAPSKMIMSANLASLRPNSFAGPPPLRGLRKLSPPRVMPETTSGPEEESQVTVPGQDHNHVLNQVDQLACTLERATREYWNRDAERAVADSTKASLEKAPLPQVDSEGYVTDEATGMNVPLSEGTDDSDASSTHAQRGDDNQRDSASEEEGSDTNFAEAPRDRRRNKMPNPNHPLRIRRPGQHPAPGYVDYLPMRMDYATLAPGEEYIPLNQPGEYSHKMLGNDRPSTSVDPEGPGASVGEPQHPQLIWPFLVRNSEHIVFLLDRKKRMVDRIQDRQKTIDKASQYLVEPPAATWSLVPMIPVRWSSDDRRADDVLNGEMDQLLEEMRLARYINYELIFLYRENAFLWHEWEISTSWHGHPDTTQPYGFTQAKLDQIHAIPPFSETILSPSWRI